MSSTALATPPSVVTPVKKTAQLARVPDSPGNWKHPRLAEITKRQNATVFSEANVKTIVYNAAALAAVLMVRALGARMPMLASA